MANNTSTKLPPKQMANVLAILSVEAMNTELVSTHPMPPIIRCESSLSAKTIGT